MSEKLNATYLFQGLTDNQIIPASSESSWTTFFALFLFHLKSINKSISVWRPLQNVHKNGVPKYFERKKSDPLLFDMTDFDQSMMAIEPGTKGVIDHFKKNHPGVPLTQKETGISPDIFLFNHLAKPMHYMFIETKIRDCSELNYNQKGTYPELVNALNSNGIKCNYFLLHSIGIGQKIHDSMKKLEDKLPVNFGIFLWEDVIRMMAETGFSLPGFTTEHFKGLSKNYTGKAIEDCDEW